MRRNFLFLLPIFALVLAGCDNPSSEEPTSEEPSSEEPTSEEPTSEEPATFDAEAFLSTLLDTDLAFTATFTEIVTSDTEEEPISTYIQNVKVALEEDSYYRYVADDSSFEYYHYVPNESGMISEYSYNNKNEVSLEEVLFNVDESYTTIEFTEYFYSPFEGLEASNFVYNEDTNTVSIDPSNVLEADLAQLVWLLTGYYEDPYGDLCFVLDENSNPTNITFELEPYSTLSIDGLSYLTYSYDVKADFVSLEDIGVPSTPYDPRPTLDGHQDLQDLFDGLASGNYTFETTMSGNAAPGTYTRTYVTDESVLVYSEYTDSYTGYFFNESDVTYVPVEGTIADGLVTTGSTKSGTKEDVYPYAPSFDFAAELFDIDGNVYTLVEAKSYAPYLIPTGYVNTTYLTYLDTSASLTFTKNEDNSWTLRYGYYEESTYTNYEWEFEVKIYDVNTTSAPFENYTVSATPFSWADLIGSRLSAQTVNEFIWGDDWESYPDIYETVPFVYDENATWSVMTSSSQGNVEIYARDYDTSRRSTTYQNLYDTLLELLEHEQSGFTYLKDYSSSSATGKYYEHSSGFVLLTYYTTYFEIYIYKPGVITAE